MDRGPIQIKPGEAGRLIVRLPYSCDLVMKIKTIAGRRWHQGEKYWTIPHTDSALAHLLALFAGEPVEVDASLRPANTTTDQKPSHQPAGDQPVATTIKLVDQVRQAIRARHFSHRTEDASVGWTGDSSFPIRTVSQQRWAKRRSVTSCRAWPVTRTSVLRRRIKR
ncbi:MAG TPA: hypothetical protein VNK46_08210 [Nitrospiraceae bacterium]|jgi:hypothetical protein|nr:hypothetical protein [Nitrospiraceae bacterium]